MTDERIPVLVKSVQSMARVMGAMGMDDRTKWHVARPNEQHTFLLLANAYYGFVVADASEDAYPPQTKASDEEEARRILEGAQVFASMMPYGDQPDPRLVRDAKHVLEAHYVDAFSLGSRRAEMGYRVARVISGVTLATRGEASVSALLVEEALKTLRRIYARDTTVFVAHILYDRAHAVFIGRASVFAMLAAFELDLHGIDMEELCDE